MTVVREYISDKAHLYVEVYAGYHVLHLVRGVDFKLFNQIKEDYKDTPLMTTTPVGHRTNRIVSRYMDHVLTKDGVNIYHIRRP